ncbi:MAG: hypothetical protein ACOYXR_02775 [Nitrospirota bacterium]
MKPITVVSATRRTPAEFEADAPLCASLRKLTIAGATIAPKIVYQNSLGLGTVYNRYLTTEYHDHILVFVHDDVRIEDLFFADKLNDAVRYFDVVGLAGNQKPDLGYPSWFDQRRPLSGFVAHPHQAPSPEAPTGTVAISAYGPSPAPCLLLDGLFLAVNADSVLSRGVRFDEQFAFHFYDLDFCRLSAAQGLRLGTWPLWVIHQSGGAFNTPAWKQAARAYQKKWAGELAPADAGSPR